MNQLRFPNYNYLQSSRESRIKAIWDLYYYVSNLQKDVDTWDTLHDRMKSIADAIDALDPSQSTDDAIAAISLQLEETKVALGQLGPKWDQEIDFSTQDYSILANGNFGTSTTYQHAVIPVNAGEEYVLIGATSDCRYAFATSGSATSGGAIPLVSGTSVVVMDTPNTYYKVTIPSGCTHLLFNAGGSYATRCYKSYSIKEVNAAIGDVSTQVTNISNRIDADQDQNYKSGSLYKDDTITEDSSCIVTDFIPYLQNQSVEWYNGFSETKSAYIIFYDSGKNPISGQYYIANSVPSRTLSCTAQACRYLRATMSSTNPLARIDVDGVTVWRRQEEIHGVQAQINEINTKIAYKSFVEKVPMNLGMIYQGRTDVNALDNRWGTIYSPLILNDGKIVTKPSGVTFACFKDGAWYQNSSVVPSDCEFFRMYKSNSEHSKPQPIELSYENQNGRLTFLKETYRWDSTNNRTLLNWFSVDVALPLDNPTTDAEDAELNFTNAWLKLPKSYSRFGKPTKLIILCPGTTSTQFASFDENQRQKVEYFSACGYAVTCCSPLTQKYMNSPEKVAAHPVGVACYQAVYDYIIRNYNIDPNGVGIFAKSAGGISQGNVINHTNIPVRASAVLCPNLDLFNDFRCMEPKSSQERMAIFNLEPLTASGAWTTEQSAILKNNQDNFVGYSPILYHNTIDATAYNNYLLEKSYPLATTQAPAKTMQVYSQELLADSTFLNIVDNAKLFLKCPVKIWYAEDDDQVPYVTILKFCKMARNGGSVCILRRMPDGTGGHGCADYSQLAEQITTTAPDGSEWTIAKGIVEALQWIEQYIG